MEMKHCIIDLPTDIIASIFLLLSVKNLLRFTCVCRIWYVIIHSSEFITMYNIARKDGNMILIHKRKKHNDFFINHFFRRNKSTGNDFSNDILEPPTPFSSEIKKHGNIHFHGACAGLVCFSLYLRKKNLLYIWNPSINKAKVIRSDTYKKNNTFDGFKVSSRVFGVCKDVAVNDYKVVRLLYMKECTNSVVVDVYTLSNNAWKRINVTDIDTYIDGYNTSSVSINGVLHWLGRRKKSIENNVIATFDPRSEVFGEIITWGRCGEYRPTFDCLGNLKGSLCSIYASPWRVSVLVMKEYGVVDSWSVYYSFVKTVRQPIYIGSNGLLAKNNDGTISMFDYNMKKWINFDKCQGKTPACYNLFDYTESLVLIDEKHSQ